MIIIYTVLQVPSQSPCLKEATNLGCTFYQPTCTSDLSQGWRQKFGSPIHWQFAGLLARITSCKYVIWAPSIAQGPVQQSPSSPSVTGPDLSSGCLTLRRGSLLKSGLGMAPLSPIGGRKEGNWAPKKSCCHTSLLHLCRVFHHD